MEEYEGAPLTILSSQKKGSGEGRGGRGEPTISSFNHIHLIQIFLRTMAKERGGGKEKRGKGGGSAFSNFFFSLWGEKEDFKRKKKRKGKGVLNVKGPFPYLVQASGEKRGAARRGRPGFFIRGKEKNEREGGGEKGKKELLVVSLQFFQTPDREGREAWGGGEKGEGKKKRGGKRGNFCSSATYPISFHLPPGGRKTWGEEGERGGRKACLTLLLPCYSLQRIHHPRGEKGGGGGEGGPLLRESSSLLLVSAL